MEVPIPLIIRNGLLTLTRKFAEILVSSLATVLVMALFPYCGNESVFAFARFASRTRVMASPSSDGESGGSLKSRARLSGDHAGDARQKIQGKTSRESKTFLTLKNRKRLATKDLIRTELAGSLEAVFESGVIERSSRNLWMVARGLRCPSSEFLGQGAA